MAANSVKKTQVFVRLKPGVLDVQGKAIEHGLHGIGMDAISDIRVGRLVEFNVKASSEAEALEVTKKVCEELLANTIIENYEIKQ
jgi:phosphoribosylformylglycinamidine synthase PurS subunit